MSLCILTINGAPEQEEDLVDYLLAHPAAPGFSAYPVYGHSEGQALSIAEQVRGRRRRHQFELILDEAAANEIIAGLAEAAGKGLVYWQQPITCLGRT